MSKPTSGHFSGTSGYNLASKNLSQYHGKDAIIPEDRYDLREHPTKYKQLGSHKLKALREKVKSRTISKEEYKHLEWQQRLSRRRNEAVKQFWKNERRLIKHNLPTTRNWNAEQVKAILSGEQPKYKGRTMASHHTYSVARYPHLANLKEFIYPVTFNEHINGWHGGNTRNSFLAYPSIISKIFRR